MSNNVLRKILKTNIDYIETSLSLESSPILLEFFGELVSMSLAELSGRNPVVPSLWRLVLTVRHIFFFDNSLVLFSRMKA
jgi:hypothetical protein